MTDEKVLRLEAIRLWMKDTIRDLERVLGIERALAVTLPLVQSLGALEGRLVELREQQQMQEAKQ